MAQAAQRWLDEVEPVRRELEHGRIVEASAEILRIVEGASAPIFDRALQLAVEFNLVDLARDLVVRAVSRHPRDRRLKHWADVLAPPTVRSVPRARPGRIRHAEWDWLREHAQEYRGKWVVLVGEKLLAANEELATASRLARKRTSATALVHFVAP
jgi:hypothetical protein